MWIKRSHSQSVFGNEERIGDVQGKAGTLHQLGILYANKGEVDQAIALFNQSLEIENALGMSKAKQ